MLLAREGRAITDLRKGPSDHCAERVLIRLPLHAGKTRFNSFSCHFCEIFLSKQSDLSLTRRLADDPIISYSSSMRRQQNSTPYSAKVVCRLRAFISCGVRSMVKKFILTYIFVLTFSLIASFLYTQRFLNGISQTSGLGYIVLVALAISVPTTLIILYAARGVQTHK